MAFEVGQHVECIDDDWISVATTLLVPRKGQVFTVRALKVIPCARHGGHLFLSFEELPNHGFVSTHFRPLSSTRLDEFRKLVAPVPGLPTVTPEEVA